MKYMSIVIGLMVSVNVFAHETTGKSLKSEMQMIGETYKQLGTQINDTSQNSSSEKLVDTLIEKSISAQKQNPPGADKLTGTKKQQMIKGYKNEIQLMVEHLKSIKVALKANDNGSALRHFEAIKPWTAPDHSVKYE